MTTKMFIDIIANDKTKTELSSVQTRLGNIKSSVFSLKGAFIGLGAGAVIRSFVNVGKEVESLQVRFKFLFGSLEEGATAFDNLTKFAARVPFSLEEISRASGNLAVVAKDAKDLNRVLEITGNVTAVTGLDFETTASQIQRAFSGGIGAADLFRERGVRALLGFSAGAKVTAEETIKRFEELFSGEGRFANATKDLATTLEGTISMIGDKYFKFQKDVAAGFFDELKGEFGDLNEFLAKNEKQIEEIARAIGENFAGAITKTSSTLKAVAPTVKNIADALGTTITGFNTLPSFVQNVGLIGALLFGKKGALAFAGVSFLVGQIKELMDKSKELADTRGMMELFDAGELNAYKLTLEEINDLVNAYKLSLTKVAGKVIDNKDNQLILEQVKLLEQVSLALKIGAKDAEDYIARQKSLNVVLSDNNDELEKTNKRLFSQFDLVKQINNSITDLTKKGLEDLKKIREEYNPLLAIRNQQEEEIQELNNAYNRKLLDFEEYQKLRKKIEEKYSKETAQKSLELLKQGRYSEIEFEKLSQQQKIDILTGARRDIRKPIYI